MRAARAIIVLLPLALSGCDMASSWMNDVSSAMPTLSLPSLGGEKGCSSSDWDCMMGEQQRINAMNKARQPQAGQGPVGDPYYGGGQQYPPQPIPQPAPPASQDPEYMARYQEYLRQYQQYQQQYAYPQNPPQQPQRRPHPAGDPYSNYKEPKLDFPDSGGEEDGNSYYGTSGGWYGNR